MPAHLDSCSLTLDISMSHLNIVMQNLTRVNSSLSTTHLSHLKGLDDVITYTITVVAQSLS